MQPFLLFANRLRPGCARGLVTALVSAVVILSCVPVDEPAAGQVIPPRRRLPINAQGQVIDTSAGVYLPTDRTLSRAITRARERLADHEYHEVLGFLQGLLTHDEDSFLERVGDDHQQTGLKATARQMIGELPPEGIEAYETLYGPTARRQLESAVRSGDRNDLANVVRQYFHTSAGYEAAFTLAQMEVDQGHRSAAAQLYRELIESPRAAAKLEPQLSVAAAINLLAAGETDQAADTLRALFKKKPSAAIVLSGKATTLPAPSTDPIAWLTRFVGKPEAITKSEANWVTIRGDAARTSQSTGGRPDLRARWEARVVNEPSIEAYLASRSDDFTQRGVVALPGARPIAVGDLVVMRTPGNVVAIDWQTGKRIWESRDEEELQPEAIDTDLTPSVDRDQVAAQGKPLEDRVWGDALMTSLASDGKRVFVVRGAPGHDEEAMSNLQAQLMARNGTENVPATNQLTAYDIATQGKLAWEIDGGRAGGKLSGAFFLGAPLAIDNSLFVMAEMGGALYLVALDPATGQLQWQQQLLKLEQGIGLDPARRRAGATPSYSGGVLVCPTDASTVVAIDVVKREFAWVYRYTREVPSVDTRNFFNPQQVQPQLVRANNQWLDGSAIIAENRVLLTPPDSSEIHCVDLRTGKLVWKRRQGDSLFLAAVDHGNVLLVGGQSVIALHLSDGAPAWDKESVALPTGVLPSGQGFLSDGQYFLPLTSGQLANIDISTGKFGLSAVGSSNVALGNLITCRGSVISQTPFTLDKFEQLSELRKRTEAALAKNDADPVALRELAEIATADGKPAEALRTLKRSYELAPNDPATQEMLVESLLAALSTDYGANRDDVVLVGKLIHNRDQQIELLRIDAVGKDQSGNRLEAWDAYLRLADFTAEEPAYLRIEDKYTVRSDRWICGRLAAMWDAASDDERKAIEEKLAARRPKNDNARTAAELRHYLSHLDQLPGADGVRLALARYLVEHDRAQEAELELLQLMVSNDHEVKSAATDLLDKLAKKGNGSESSRVDWPHGRVASEVSSVTSTAQNDRGAMAPNEQKPGFRPLRIEQDFAPQVAPVQWYISTDCNEIVGRNLLGDDIYHLTVGPNNLVNQYRDSNLVHGARLGHLLYVAVGGQILPIDSRQDRQSTEGELLWPSASQENALRDPARPRRGPATTIARGNRPPLYHAFGRKRVNGAYGAGLGSLGPVTPRGVVIEDENELKCVDPLTGATLWSRTDIPPGCELFGDGNLVFAANVGDTSTYVLRVTDGQLIGKRERSKAEWLMTAGRNLAQLTFAPSRRNPYLLTITDVWEQKKLFEAELPTASPNAARFSVIEPNAIAIFEPEGRFRVIDVRTAQPIVDEKLEPLPDTQALYTMVSGDTLFVFISGQWLPQYRPIAPPIDYPIVNGLVYAFSMKSGKQVWPGPALVRNRGIYLSQPADVPFLVFAERMLGKDASTNGGSQIRVLCIDKRTGESVYRNDNVADTLITRFRIEGENESGPVVSLEAGAARIQLALSDRPHSPQPPANDDLESTREVAERGLRGLGVQLGGALRGALERPARIPPQVPRQPQPVDHGPKPTPK